MCVIWCEFIYMCLFCLGQFACCFFWYFGGLLIDRMGRVVMLDLKCPDHQGPQRKVLLLLQMLMPMKIHGQTDYIDAIHHIILRINESIQHNWIKIKLLQLLHRCLSTPTLFQSFFLAFSVYIKLFFFFFSVYCFNVCFNFLSSLIR